MAWQLYQGDALETLKQMEDESINCCVTSPPYWGLRDYGVDGQLGLEPTPDEYVAKMVEVFREVKRVLRKDGNCWLNLGDTYAANRGYQVPQTKDAGTKRDSKEFNHMSMNSSQIGLKPKDIVGIPWRVAFALQEDGWWLRSDIIWHKPNAMPESVTDRPTRAHEYIFLLSKSPKYYYDYEAIKEPAVYEGRRVSCDPNSHANTSHPGTARKQDLVGNRRYTGFNARWENRPAQGRNKRTVWNINTKPFPEAHFAVFPPEIPEICIKAGCPGGGTVLDPFAGAGTTLYVAEQLGRNSIGIELNPDYCDIIRRRMAGLEMNLFQIQ
jgi:DNA modification methylase